MRSPKCTCQVRKHTLGLLISVAPVDLQKGWSVSPAQAVDGAVLTDSPSVTPRSLGHAPSMTTSDLSTHSTTSLISNEEQFEDYGEGDDVDCAPSSPCPDDETRTNVYSDLGSSVSSRWPCGLEWQFGAREKRPDSQTSSGAGQRAES